MKKVLPVFLVGVVACCICQTEFEKVGEASLDADPDPEIIAYNGVIGGEKYTRIFVDYNNTGESSSYKYVLFVGETMGAGYDPDQNAGMVWIDTDMDGVNDLVVMVQDENGDGFYEVSWISPP